MLIEVFGSGETQHLESVITCAEAEKKIRAIPCSSLFPVGSRAKIFLDSGRLLAVYIREGGGEWILDPEWTGERETRDDLARDRAAEAEIIEIESQES